MDEKALAAELQATKDDANEWGEAEGSPESSEPKKRLTAMVSIRLAKNELDRVQRRANERGQTVSAFLRDLVLRDLTSDPPTSSGLFDVSISTGGTYSAHLDTPTLLIDGSRLATLSG